MTKRSKFDLVLEALTLQRIPEHVTRAVLQHAFGVGAVHNDAAAFDAIKKDIRAARRSLICNKPRWAPELREIYEDYIAVLDSTLANVESVSGQLFKNPDDPNGPRIPATVSRVSYLAEKRNRSLREKGLPVGPSCGHVWTSWVDPATVQAFTDRVEIAYASMKRGRGQRFYPFAPRQVRHTLAEGVHRHRAFIKDQRRAIFVASPPDKEGRVTSAYGALQLAALRQAEMWLDRYEKDVATKLIHPATSPVPVNWKHLLDQRMRDRLSAADTDPTQVTIDGLTSFYVAPAYSAPTDDIED